MEKIMEMNLFFLVPYCVKTAINQYLRERHFKINGIHCKNIKWAIEEMFEGQGIEECIKNLEVSYIKNQRHITAKVDYIWLDEMKTENLTFNITKLRKEHKKNYKELEEITVYEDGIIRFAGEFNCFTVSKTDDLTDMGLYNNKYESNMHNVEVYYQGDLRDGVPNGNGRLTWYNGNGLYEGEFADGKVAGFGKGYFISGKISAEGYWVNGKLEGKATQYYENGNIEYVGEYKSGFNNGFGSSYYPDGKLLFEGMWEDGWNIGPIIKYSKNGVSFMYDNEKFYLVKPNGDKIREITEKELDKLID